MTFPSATASVRSFEHRVLYYFLVTTLGILGFGLLLLCLTPPVSRDALIHHLTLPKLYLQHGGITEFPHMVFSYYPGNLQLLYMVPLYFGNDILPKVIHWAFGVGTAFLIVRYLWTKAGPSLAVLGAVFFLSVPAIVRLSISAYVDMGLVFFGFGSLLFFLRWAETVGEFRFFWGSAVFVGLALGTKYNGLILLFVLTCFVVLASVRQEGTGPVTVFRPLFLGIIFAAIGFAIFSPWMIRNYAWTGNPFYPLFSAVFSSDAAISGSEVFSAPGARKLGLLTYRRILYDESWLEVILLPFRLFFQGEDNNLRLFDGRLNPGLLVFPFFAFWPNPPAAERRDCRWLGLFVLLYFGYTFFSRELRARYFVPIVPPLAILSIFGLKNIMSQIQGLDSRAARRAAQGLLVAGLGGALLWNGLYLQDQFASLRPWMFLSGEVSREEYISVRRPEYAAMQHINRHLSGDARILFFFMGRRGYYCDRSFRFDIQGGKSHLMEILESEENPRTRLLSDGITHFLIQLPVFQRWILEDLSAEQRILMKNFFDANASLVFSKYGYGVYELNLNSKGM